MAKLKIKTLNNKAIKGLEVLEKYTKKILVKRLMKTKWLNDEHTEIEIKSKMGGELDKGKLNLFLSSICMLSKADYIISK